MVSGSYLVYLITINQKEHPEVFLDEIFMYCALNCLIGVGPDYY